MPTHQKIEFSKKAHTEEAKPIPVTPGLPSLLEHVKGLYDSLWSCPHVSFKHKNSQEFQP